MTSSARDITHGRQGGRWLDHRKDDGACHTCRNGTARYVAQHQVTGERWPVCDRCRQQASKYSAPILHTPIDEAAA